VTISSKITPCLWFDSQAEDAARHYVTIFPDSRIEIHGRAAGSVMTVAFRLCGQSFTALNGGPLFKFSEAISLQIDCGSQAEIDHYWSQLGEGGEEGPCGWLKDRFGLSWQVVPSRMAAMLADPDPRKGERVMKAFLPMKKLDLATLERAYAGEN
jgi:predicted 3-demethylubiquinone-9 3-methyltransferase (glyoxalase superfamily)